jgi:hypothetical protein
LGSEINSQTQSFDAYRNSFLRVISVIIEIINYPFKLGKMRFRRPYFIIFISGHPLAFFRLATLGQLSHYKKDPSYANAIDRGYWLLVSSSSLRSTPFGIQL